MVKMIFICLAACLLSRFALAASPVEINGQVFIVTKGGNSIKLGLVPVAVYERAAIDKFLEEKKKAAAPVVEYFTPWYLKAKEAYENASKAGDSLNKAWMNDISNAGLEKQYEQAKKIMRDARDLKERLSGYIEYTRSGKYLFDGLPPELQHTKTDPDGKFSFTVQPGSYVLVAVSQREIGDHLEAYFWMVPIGYDADKKTVMLSNDNLSSSGSGESLVATDDDELSVCVAMKDIDGIQGLTKIVDGQKKRQEEEANNAIEADRKRDREASLIVFRRNPSLAQKKAMELYPALVDKNSPLNIEFVARYKRYQAERMDFFTEPDWPIRLAKEISDEPTGKGSEQH